MKSTAEPALGAQSWLGTDFLVTIDKIQDEKYIQL